MSLEENAEILAGFEKRGSDLGPVRLVDFVFIFPNDARAEAFAALVREQGFSTRIQQFAEEEEDPWEVTASKEMQPSAANITETEMRLDALARTCSGQGDGWGFFKR